MNYYSFELCDDNFEILPFDNDSEAIREACERDDVMNVVKIDSDLNEIETIF